MFHPAKIFFFINAVLKVKNSAMLKYTKTMMNKNFNFVTSKLKGTSSWFAFNNSDVFLKEKCDYFSSKNNSNLSKLSDNKSAYFKDPITLIIAKEIVGKETDAGAENLVRNLPDKFIVKIESETTFWSDMLYAAKYLIFLPFGFAAFCGYMTALGYMYKSCEEILTNYIKNKN